MPMSASTITCMSGVDNERASSKAQPATTTPRRTELRLGPNKVFRRVLYVGLIAWSADSSRLSVRMVASGKSRALTRSLAFSYARMEDCGLLYPSDVLDDDVSLIVQGTHFAVTRKEAAQLIDAFGLTSRTME